MTILAATLNIVLGTAYCGYGMMTAVEMKRDYKSFGFSHFGAAWIFMAFTCGPHHLFHGVHLAFEGRTSGAVDVVAVIVGLPAGVLWLYLRVEAFAGGRGDRFIMGTPSWIRLARPLSLLYAAFLAVAAASLTAGGITVSTNVIANASLVVIYFAIGWFVLRTQLANRPTMGGWSVSGLCLSVIFPTCALMHGVSMLYFMNGTYEHDVHGWAIDWLSIPAGLYFLWVVRGLYRDTLHDWNEGPEEVLPSELVEQLA